MSSRSDGQDYDRVDELRGREHERDLERAAHKQNLSYPDLDQAEVEYLRELIKSDLDSGTIEVLDNLISPDFILSNVREKDISTFMWQLETKILQLFAMHPPRGGVGGRARSYYYDDPNDVLEPLRPQDRAKIREFKDGILWRARRSKDGYQQDKIGESTSRVETVKQDEEKAGRSRGRLRGFLGR